MRAVRNYLWVAANARSGRSISEITFSKIDSFGAQGECWQWLTRHESQKTVTLAADGLVFHI
jgi:hypothetical protein